jgi:hypothetical protein
MRNKNLRTYELTKAMPAIQLTPAQRPRRRRDKNVGGGGAAPAARTTTLRFFFEGLAISDISKDFGAVYSTSYQP